MSLRNAVVLKWCSGLLLSFCVLFSSAEGEFGYHGEKSPDHWCELSSSFGRCCEGKTQSPVNIVKAETRKTKLPKLDFDYDDVTLNVINNGHTVQATVEQVEDDPAMLRIGDQIYVLKQFHFHVPSEHEIDGQPFPVEWHLVHQAEDGTLAVVGVLIEEGRENDELELVLDQLPTEEGDQAAIRNFDLDDILPDTLTSYRYDGSLTTPPCSEGVHWNLLSEPLEMSDKQIEQLVQLFSGNLFPNGNRRPVQPLNGRDIQTDS